MTDRCLDSHMSAEAHLTVTALTDTYRKATVADVYKEENAACILRLISPSEYNVTLVNHDITLHHLLFL